LGRKKGGLKTKKKDVRDEPAEKNIGRPLIHLESGKEGRK